MSQAILALLTLLRFLWKYGPTIYALVQSIADLITQMTDDQERSQITIRLSNLIASKTLKKDERIAALRQLECEAKGCKLS